MKVLPLLFVFALAGCGEQARINERNVAWIAVGTIVLIGAVLDANCSVEDPC